MCGWGGRIRTYVWRNQNPLPYRLATPQFPTGPVWGRTILAASRSGKRAMKIFASRSLPRRIEPAPSRDVASGLATEPISVRK
jgi:hypothetical protein